MNDLINIKGLGEKNIKLLNILNINSINDLITYYPFRYELIKRSDLDKVTFNDKVYIDGVVENVPVVVFFRGRKMNKMTFKLNTGAHLINVSIFNRAFLKNNLIVGKVITVVGKYDQSKNMFVANDIRFSSLPNHEKLESVYHVTSGLSNKVLSSYITSALSMNVTVDDYILPYKNNEYGFLDKETAIKNIHLPSNLKIYKESLIRLKYEELFIFMSKIMYLKNKITNNDDFVKRNIDLDKIDEFIRNLPFLLTKDQITAVKDIIDDFNSKKRMNRLLQGDVGSGKTIVAIISIYANYISGYQSALMVPTEILAIQHFNSIKNIFDNYGIKVELLTSSTKNKKDIYKRLADNNIDVLIGTHAIIQDDVKFNNLGLVITDEQHRFGVNQRGNLKNKSKMCDVLYMSATPIPRTYALIIYGDMDISSIKTMPSNRKSINTMIKKNSEIKDVLTHLFNEMDNNHQVFVIAPMIEEMEEEEIENIKSLEDKMNKAFKDKFRIASIHGKMKSKEKDTIMQDFKDHKYDMLISTTVIEVGIDIPSATTIVIFNAERFGLSQLHQLRGRVGRSNLESYCILISDKNIERLKVLEETNDGFIISEKDFEFRGEGDLFGTEQSGDMVFKIANIKDDYKILLQAKKDAVELLKQDDIRKYNIYKLLKNLDKLN